MIHLICTLEPARIPFLPQFVEHYSLLGVQNFHLSLQIEPALPAAAADKAQSESAAILKPYGISLAFTLVQPFNSLHLRAHHDAIISRECKADDWILWADIDEFQVYPGDFRSLIRFAEASQLDYFIGYLVERAAADGTLRPFNPAESLWTQYPRRFTLPGVDPDEKTYKVTCARPQVAISRGNHFPVGDKSFRYYADRVEIHHFKWDETVMARLSRRLQPDFRDNCPWWTESRDLIDFIRQNGGIAKPEE
jgi:hypothetical protein